MARLLIYNFIVLILFNLAHPVTPEMLIVKNAPEYMNGVLFSLMSLAMFIFSSRWGKYIDNKDVRVPMIAGCVGYGICQLGFMYFNSYYIMGIFRFISGLFACGFNVGVMYLISQKSSSEDRVKNFGLLLVSSSFGGLVGQTISGYIGQLFENGYIIPFIIQFVGSAIISIIMYFTIRTEKKEERVIKNVKRTSYGLIKKLGITYFVLLVTFMSTSLALYTSNIGYFMVEQFNLSSLSVAYVNDLNFVVTLLMNLLVLRYLSSKIKPQKLLSIMILVGIISFSIVIYFSNLVSIIPLVLFLSAMSIMKPIFQKLAADFSSDYQGELLGIVNGFFSLGMIFGSFLSGVLYALGAMLPFYAIIVFLGLSFAMYLGVKRGV